MKMFVMSTNTAMRDGEVKPTRPMVPPPHGLCISTEMRAPMMKSTFIPSVASVPRTLRKAATAPTVNNETTDGYPPFLTTLNCL